MTNTNTVTWRCKCGFQIDQPPNVTAVAHPCSRITRRLTPLTPTTNPQGENQ